MEFIVEEHDVKTDQDSDDDPQGYSTQSETPDVETSDPYFKFKFLVEELLIIFSKRKEKCGICVEYIVKLCQHIGETHEDDQNPPNISGTETCSNQYPSQHITPTNVDMGLEEIALSNESRNSVIKFTDTRPEINQISTVDDNLEEKSNELNDTRQEGSSSLHYKQKRRRSAKIPTYINYSKKRPFECGVCGKGFAKPTNLKIHKLVHIHTSHKPVKCDVCGKSLSTKSNLKTHKLIHTGEKPFQCEFCGKNFTTSSNLKAHKFIHTREKSHKHLTLSASGVSGTKQMRIKPNKCNLCGKSFLHLSHLTRHFSTHTKEKHFKCDVCGNSFTRSDYLTIHKLIHTGVKAFKCNECGKSFSTKCNLNYHTRIHTGEKKFKCDKCGKFFLLSGYLRAHERRDNCTTKTTCGKNKKVPRKSHKCLTCGELFGNTRDFYTHGLTQHGVTPFKCDLCGKNFTRSTHLKIHTFIHTRGKLKTHRCQTCGKMFWTKDQLNTHTYVHTGEKRFQCGLCGRGFPFKSLLNTHILSHTREKPFKCDECGKGFRVTWDLRGHKNKNNCKREKTRHKIGIIPNNRGNSGEIVQNTRDLQTHKSKHTGEWPFKCGICGKGFFYNCHLMKHRVKHARPGNEPFKCEVCGKGFYYNSHLNAHRSLHTGVGAFKCDECGKSYFSSRQLKFHKRQHNKGKIKVPSTEGVPDLIVIE